jgi:hypothetical protein
MKPFLGMAKFGAVVLVLATLFTPGVILGQGETTSAIAGQVNDQSGAAMEGARVTATNERTGLKRQALTDDAGRFAFPQMKPGIYVLRVSAPGFEEPAGRPVTAALGETASATFTLKPARLEQNVTVMSEAPLISAENPNTTTTLTARSLENLPNPGGDLTMPAQMAMGALINTAGSSNDFVGGQNGYGNVEFNGLPALSNAYIVDGLETNDPLTNLNSGLSTNLVLGLNSIEEVTVNTTSYAVDQGRYGASQVNYVTKSGTNNFHGNLYELWNGSRLNAVNFFTNATGGHKPRSNVNHFGGSLGGPIKRDKLFFFGDFEQMRIALPIVSNVVVPSPGFQSYVLAQLARGGVDSVSGAVYPAAPALVPFYRQMFSLYRKTGGTPLPVLGCPLSASGGFATNGDGCANRSTVSQSSGDHEQVMTARLDHNIDINNMVWYRFQSDTGLQAAYTDPINPLFNAISSQPLYSFAAGYTHIFSQNLLNYFNPAFSWYESLFGPKDLSQTLAAFPIVLQGIGSNAPFTTLGGLNYNWVQGRRATRFQLSDSIAWTAGRHQVKIGVSARRLRLNDYNFSSYETPLVTYSTLPQFIYGVASTATKAFPVAASQPFNYLNLDVFAQDTMKVTQRLTWTFGVRGGYNSNPLSPHNLFARLAGSFDATPHDPNQPLNQILHTGLDHAFASTPPVIWQPRTAVAWQFAPRTIVRSGFGVFSDLMPGSVVDLIASNPPYVNTFQGGVLGQAGGLAIAPGVPNSAVDSTIAANREFLAGFRGGRTPLPPVALAAVPDGELRAPYFLQWSFGVEHQVGNSGSVKAQYVGTRAVNQPYMVQANGYQTVCQGCFQPFPYERPTDSRFAAVTQLATGANSHYNGLQITGEKRLARGFQARVNYTWSHCLDTVSNGGFLSFSTLGIISPLPGQLGRQYGNCDYDIRHNLNGSYVYELPFRSRNAIAGKLINGWQVSGTVFVHSGVPFTVQSAPYTANGNGILQGGGPQFASVRPGVPGHSRRDATRHDSVAESRCVRIDGGCEHGGMRGRRFGGHVPVWQSWTQCAPGAEFLLERPVRDAEVRDRGPGDAPAGRAVFQRVEPYQLRIAYRGGRDTGQTRDADWLRRADFREFAAHGPARRGSGRR